jgi:RNase P subunit RPR2
MKVVLIGDNSRPGCKNCMQCTNLEDAIQTYMDGKCPKSDVTSLDYAPKHIHSAFCSTCARPTTYSLHTRQDTFTVRGKSYGYEETYAKCKICEDEIYVPMVNDINAVARETAYFGNKESVT